MSNPVAPAPAETTAEEQERPNNPAARQNQQNAPVRGDDRAAQNDDEVIDQELEEGTVVEDDPNEQAAAPAETSLAGEFSFDLALAEAAESAGSLISEAEAADRSGDAQFFGGDGAGGTVLLIGAVALAGLGIWALVDDGDDDDDIVPPGNEPPTGPETIEFTFDEDTVFEGEFDITDADDDVLTYAVSTDPEFGAVELGEDGTFTYTPDANYFGEDSFVVTVTDAAGNTFEQTVNVTINPVIDEELNFEFDEGEFGEGTPFEGAFDIGGADPEGYTFDVTTDAQFGTFARGEGGTFTYTPSAGFFGQDSVVVTVTDGEGESFTQTINFTVNPDIDVEQDAELDEDEPFEGTLDLGDADPADLTFEVAGQPQSGTVTLNADGTFTYTPDENFFGEDSFIVRVTDADGQTSAQRVNLTINPVIDEELNFNVDPDTAFEGAFDIGGVDAEGYEFAFAEDGEPTSGTVEFGEGGTFTYTPNEGFIGPDSFVVTVTDGEGESFTQTINLTVGDALESEYSIDIMGENNEPFEVDAGDGAYVFTDDATVDTDVIITGFSDDDVIQVTGAGSSDYNFGTGFGDDANDLIITFNDEAFNNIILDAILPEDAGFVYDYDTAIAAVGYDFITFDGGTATIA